MPVRPWVEQAGRVRTAGIFVFSRAAIWVVAALALAWYPPGPAQGDQHGYGAGLWVRWDAKWFLDIARHGYSSGRSQADAFFPLYPAAVAGAGRAIGDLPLAGLLVSLVGYFIAFELLWRLAERHVGAAARRRSWCELARPDRGGQAR